MKDIIIGVLVAVLILSFIPFKWDESPDGPDNGPDVIFVSDRAEGHAAFVVQTGLDNIPNPPEPRPTPDGPHPDVDKCACKGTGMITHGDGHQTPCPYHGRNRDEPSNPEYETKTEKPKSQPEYETKTEKPKPQATNNPKVQMLFFTAKWCAPCQKFKETEIPKLMEAGWDVSTASNAQVRIIDIDENRELWNEYRQKLDKPSLPAFCVLKNGDYKASAIGLQSAHIIATEMVAWQNGEPRGRTYDNDTSTHKPEYNTGYVEIGPPGPHNVVTPDWAANAPCSCDACLGKVDPQPDGTIYNGLPSQGMNYAPQSSPNVYNNLPNAGVYSAPQTYGGSACGPGGCGPSMYGGGYSYPMYGGGYSQPMYGGSSCGPGGCGPSTYGGSYSSPQMYGSPMGGGSMCGPGGCP